MSAVVTPLSGWDGSGQQGKIMPGLVKCYRVVSHVSPYLTRCPRDDQHVAQHKAQVKGMPVLQLLRTCTACKQLHEA